MIEIQNFLISNLLDSDIMKIITTVAVTNRSNVKPALIRFIKGWLINKEMSKPFSLKKGINWNRGV